MVKRSLLTITLFILALSIITASVESQLEYHLEHEWVKIWVNQDGTIDLLYDIVIVCDAGTLTWMEIGQPNGDFTIEEALDEHGNPLSTSDTSQPGNYKVRVIVGPFNAPESRRFTLLTNVGRMIWEDLQNPGNAGLEFTPTWFPVRVENLSLSIVMPPGVEETELRTTHVLWNSTSYEDSRLVAYWEISHLSPNEKRTLGASFPKEFVEHYETQPDEPQPGFMETYESLIGVFAALFLIFAIILILLILLRKKNYLKPIMSMEALGIRRGLTAVEASYILDLKPKMIVTEILYSLLKKRAIWVTSTKPAVTLKVIKGARTNTTLRYYEIDFLNAVKNDGQLDEKKLAKTITFLSRTVEEKLRGYCRRDTIDYYRKIVDTAWQQVEQAGTPGIASKAYDEQLLWLLLDPEHQTKTKMAFKDRVFEPAPLWFWYWYNYQHHHPQPTHAPSRIPPSGKTAPPKLPGADFADGIATAVENTSNSIVVNIEKFANSIIPAAKPAKTSHSSAHRGSSCVCACAACACACACVSCACACAGGGAG